MDIPLADATATEALGAALARVCPARCRIFLHGDRGAGKTSLSRGFLRGLGYRGRVKSPTYTLLEPYDIEGPPPRRVCHFDLYRLADAEELLYLGAEDCLAAEAISLVEWPQRGQARLPAADLEVRLEYQGEGRRARLRAASEPGRQLLQKLSLAAASD